MPFKNIQNRKEYNINRYEENRILLLSLKKDCQICGWNLHPEVLEFHHKVKSDKLFNLSGNNLVGRSKESILNETKKCLIVCANCHKWIHYNEREWFREVGRKK